MRTADDADAPNFAARPGHASRPAHRASPLDRQLREPHGRTRVRGM